VHTLQKHKHRTLVPERQGELLADNKKKTRTEEPLSVCFSEKI
jgi:hypothetical protein